jgi:hypothetical protein
MPLSAVHTLQRRLPDCHLRLLLRTFTKRLIHVLMQTPMPGTRCRYGCYLYWQLHSHKALFSDVDGEDGEDSEQAQLSLPTSFGMLAVITVVVAGARRLLGRWGFTPAQGLVCFLLAWLTAVAIVVVVGVLPHRLKLQRHMADMRGGGGGGMPACAVDSWFTACMCSLRALLAWPIADKGSPSLRVVHAFVLAPAGPAGACVMRWRLHSDALQSGVLIVCARTMHHIGVQ